MPQKTRRTRKLFGLKATIPLAIFIALAPSLIILGYQNGYFDTVTPSRSALPQSGSIPDAQISGSRTVQLKEQTLAANADLPKPLTGNAILVEADYDGSRDIVIMRISLPQGKFLSEIDIVRDKATENMSAATIAGICNGASDGAGRAPSDALSRHMAAATLEFVSPATGKAYRTISGQDLVCNNG